MPKVSKRQQTQVQRLQELLDSAREISAQRAKECEDLRKAGQQLWKTLKEFGNENNWKIEGTLTDDGNEIDRYVWKGTFVGEFVDNYQGDPGDALNLAKTYLGEVEQDGPKRP